MSLLITAGLGVSQIVTPGTGPSLNPTQYMYLTLPIVSVTAGPLYASDINASMLLIDAHNHSPGKGALVPVTGLNINGNLVFNGNQATNLDALVFNIRAATLGTTGIGTLYTSGVDLFYVDGNGNVIKITASGGVNAGASTGGWTGNYAVGPAFSTASYTTIGTVFALLSQVGPNQYGNLAVGSIQLYPSNTTNAAAITLNSPLGISGAYSIKLPLTPVAPLVASSTIQLPLMAKGDGAGNLILVPGYSSVGGMSVPPAVVKMVQMDANGNFLPNLLVDNATLLNSTPGAAASTLSVGVIQTANIATSAVGLTKLGVVWEYAASITWTNLTGVSGTFSTTVVSVGPVTFGSAGVPLAGPVRVYFETDLGSSSAGGGVSLSSTTFATVTFTLVVSPSIGGIVGPVWSITGTSTPFTAQANALFGTVTFPAGYIVPGTAYTFSLLAAKTLASGQYSLSFGAPRMVVALF